MRSCGGAKASVMAARRPLRVPLPGSEPQGSARAVRGGGPSRGDSLKMRHMLGPDLMCHPSRRRLARPVRGVVGRADHVRTWPSLGRGARPQGKPASSPGQPGAAGQPAACGLGPRGPGGHARSPVQRPGLPAACEGTASPSDQRGRRAGHRQALRTKHRGLAATAALSGPGKDRETQVTGRGCLWGLPGLGWS